eukprot:UN12910
MNLVSMSYKLLKCCSIFLSLIKMILLWIRVRAVHSELWATILIYNEGMHRNLHWNYSKCESKYNLICIGSLEPNVEYNKSINQANVKKQEINNKQRDTNSNRRNFLFVQL